MNKGREPVGPPAPLPQEVRLKYSGFINNGWRSRRMDEQLLTKIEEALSDAVKHEEYELAAGLRDALQEATGHYESLPTKLIQVRT